MPWEIRYKYREKTQCGGIELSRWTSDPVKGNFKLRDLEEARKQAQQQVRASMAYPCLVWEVKLKEVKSK